jgi:3-oxoacyl-(acyl-carrier-protein) synthase III
MDSFLIDVPVPSMGATVSELTVIDIKVQNGARVAKGDKIAELESDKSVFEFESPCDGVVLSFACRAGDIVESGAPFVRMETADLSQRHLLSSGAAAAVSTRAATATLAAASVAPVPKAAAPAAVNPAGGPVWTPRAIKLLQDAGIDPAAVTAIDATGPGGRVSGDDVARYLASRPAPAGETVAKAAAGAVAVSVDGTVCIAGVGYAVPKNIRPTSDILKAFPGRTEEEMLKLTGIKERRYAGESETATDLAAIAVEHALVQAGIKIEQIDGLIMATVIPDQPIPSMACALARRLGIPKALAFDLNAACSGWLYALEVGRCFIRGGTAKNLVVVTAELLSRITNPKDHETAFLFGDGAGAAILTSASGGHRLHRMGLSSDANQFEAIERRGGGARQPVPHPGGHDRDDFYLRMNGTAVFKSAVIGFADQIEATLARHQLTAADVDWIVPHQANERILRAVGKRVGIPYDKFVVTIAKYGNTSGASVSMALGWAVEEGIFQPGNKIVFCSVGAGLTFAGGLLVW